MKNTAASMENKVYGNLMAACKKRQRTRLLLSAAVMVLGFILGRIVESNFRTGVISGRGSVMGFFSRPIAICLVAFGIFMAVWTNRGGFKKKKNAKAD